MIIIIIIINEHRYCLRPGPSPSTSSYYSWDAANASCFHTDTVPISGIALSTCSHDGGAFEVSFDGERYAPFEGAELISRWRLELPSPVRQFDYNSITDVLLTFHFTSLNGVSAWRDEAARAVRDFRAYVNEDYGGGGTCLLVDLAADFASEWRRFGSHITASSGADKAKPVAMPVDRIPHMLPFSCAGHEVTVQHIWATVQPAE
jgi:hypothetical protein